MVKFLSDNLGTIFVLIGLIVFLGMVVKSVVKTSKKGNCHCDCCKNHKSK